MILSVFYEHIAEAAAQAGKPITEILRAVKSYGITAVEMDNARLIQNEEEIINNLSASGLKINCIYSFFDFGANPDPKKGFELVDTAKRTGSSKILVVPGFLNDACSPDIYLNNMCSAVSQICNYAKDCGITVTMEDFDDSNAPYSTIKGLLYFMKNVPYLTCAFDTGNFLYSEEDVSDALPLLKKYISHVHCKDRSLEEKANEEPKITVKGRKLYSSPVGHGCIPMKEMLTELIQNGYDDSLAIEHFGSQNQLEDIKKSAKWLLDLIK